MGKNSRERRDARRRAHGSAPRPTSDAPDAGTVTQADLVELISRAARYAAAAPGAAGPRIRQLNELAATAESGELNPASLVVGEVLSRISRAWEHGWQPQELVHAVRRHTSASAARWVGRAVLVDARRSDAMQQAPGRK